MKKSDSKNNEKDLEKELKQLRKENKRLKLKFQTTETKNKELKKELKKSRSEENLGRRTTEVAFEDVPGHRFSIQLIMLCVLIYTQTGCGLRTVVSILQIFEKVLRPAFGKAPSYNTVRNWILKLGLSVYADDFPKKMKKFAVIIDESIMINKEKLLLVLGFETGDVKGPLQHKDMTVLGMRVGESFKRTVVSDEINRIAESCGSTPEYGISDGAHNLVGGFKDSGVTHHLDIRHTLSFCLIGN